MPTLPHWPGKLLRPAKADWSIGGQTISGGATLSGVMTSVHTDGGGLWRASLGAINIIEQDQRRTWKALRAICDGGAQPIIVPVYESEDAPWPVVGGVPLMELPAVPHSDDATHSDGSGYASSCIEAYLAADAALRATSLTIEIVAGSDLQGGELFSIDHPELRWRLYQVRTLLDNGDGTFAVTIRPPLRRVAFAGDPVEFDRPKCVMKLARADGMAAEFESVEIAAPSVDFIEAFPPFPDWSAT